MSPEGRDPRSRTPGAGRFAWPALLVLLATSTGCPRFTMPKDIVPLEAGPTCPVQTYIDVVRHAQGYGYATPTDTLECDLVTLRKAPFHDARTATAAARICFHLAERETDKGRMVRMASEGVRWAEFAIENGRKDDGPTHYFLAINLGVAVRHEMVLAIRNLGRLEAELKLAVKLDPEEDDGGPLRTLGMLYLKAPSWPNGIGDVDKALDLLAKAAKEYPAHPLNHLFYAQALYETEGKDAADRVKAQLQAALDRIATCAWGLGADRWRRDVLDLASRAGVKLP